MKKILFYIFCCLVMHNFAAAQGTSCASAITLSLDGVLRNYSTSSTTGTNMVCTANGTTPVTWFRFTTNATAECPLLNITASDSAALEVAFYTSCSSMLTSSSMCFYSGFGLWAPNENFLASPNTTYYLRVKTSSACTVKIAGQHYSPANSSCPGATSLGGTLINDNNSCNHADPNILPSQVCALTLENTAWYQFFVATTGYSIITISNIHCDNGSANNNSGFQMGFFTGSCSSLQALNCSNGSGPTVQATTNLLPAGTKVFLAIDGISGANCSYSISGLNVLGVLSGTIKNFSGWKSSHANTLQWTTLLETGGRYVVERSEDGVHFKTIGEVASSTAGKENTAHHYDDVYPPAISFYRLKLDNKGKAALSEIVQINRSEVNGVQLYALGTTTQQLQLQLLSNVNAPYEYSIYSMHGQLVAKGTRQCQKGRNILSIDVASLAQGQYNVVVRNNLQQTHSFFIKN